MAQVRKYTSTRYHMTPPTQCTNQLAVFAGVSSAGRNEGLTPPAEMCRFDASRRDRHVETSPLLHFIGQAHMFSGDEHRILFLQAHKNIENNSEWIHALLAFSISISISFSEIRPYISPGRNRVLQWLCRFKVYL